MLGQTRTIALGLYTDSVSHVSDELQRLHLRLSSQVLRRRHCEHTSFDALSGLYIKDEQIDQLFIDAFDLSHDTAAKGVISEPLHEVLMQWDTRIAEKTAASREASVHLSLMRVQEQFELSNFEMDVFLLVLAPELDQRYETFFAYLQDDVTKKRPSINLALELLCPSVEARLRARSYFSARAPLFAHHLLQRYEEPSQTAPTLLQTYLKIDERVVNFVLDGNAVDTRLQPYLNVVTPQTQSDTLHLPAEMMSHLMHLMQPPTPIFYFQGPYGVGKRATAEALCRQAQHALCIVDGAQVLQADHLPFDRAVKLIVREASLQHAAIYWTGFDALLDESQAARRHRLLTALAKHRGGAFLAGEVMWEPGEGLHALPFMRVAFPRPSYPQRMELWRDALDQASPALQAQTDIDVSALANTFRLSGGQIRDAVATAGRLARWRAPRDHRLCMADLANACRLQSSTNLAALAQQITPHYTWDDIVLPPEQRDQLRQMCDYMQFRSLVYDTWGFDRKFAMGKGIHALFAGPSGTGKTMAADIMAGELGLDLYKIDLSSVVSKYIGETEKNLSRIFTEAESSNAILFFDEADALFGKRSDVKDAHDRYANIETNYLLQRLEAYEGVVILATNLRKNMDDAFVRRLHFIIDFPFPTEAERQCIWEQVWPDTAPLGSDLDLPGLARRVELAGGHIRNVALAAAFLAAADGGAITMEHLFRALRREFRKMGKMVSEGEWQDLQQKALQP